MVLITGCAWAGCLLLEVYVLCDGFGGTHIWQPEFMVNQDQNVI